MPWVGPTFTLVHDFVADRDAGPPDSLIQPEKVMEMFQDFADGITEVIKTDGSIPAVADIPMGGFRLTALGDGTEDDDACTVAQAAGGIDWVGTIGGTSTRYTVTHTTAPAVVPAGFRFSGLISAANSTTSSVVSFNGGADTPIKTRFGHALAVGDLPLNSIATFRFVSGEWRIESITPSDILSGGGTADYAAYVGRILQICTGGVLGPLVPGAAGMLGIDADGVSSVVNLLNTSPLGTTVTISPVSGSDGTPIGTIANLVAATVVDSYSREGIV